LHNCSGKHTGMMSLARFLESPVAGYSDYHHQTQQHWMNALADLSGIDVRKLPWDRDGCGLPALAMPLRYFAATLAQYCALETQPSTRAQAMNDILIAMHDHPDMVAGTDRCCTATMKAHKDLVVKTGAEGVFAAIAPSAGIALALKIDDGATRAADAALGAVLKRLGVLSADEYDSLKRWYAPDITNSQNVVTGRLAAAAVWDA
ncbi:MAG: asparaginase, partial [Pseudomonadota bacterium]